MKSLLVPDLNIVEFTVEYIPDAERNDGTFKNLVPSKDRNNVVWGPQPEVWSRQCRQGLSSNPVSPLGCGKRLIVRATSEHHWGPGYVFGARGLGGDLTTALERTFDVAAPSNATIPVDEARKLITITGTYLRCVFW